MRPSQNTILITGGASGIGLALARRFSEAGNTVIICGRRQARLEEAHRQNPALRTRACDLASESERVALAQWLTQSFPDFNVLVNCAGIQRRVDLRLSEPWEQTRSEIAINLEAPIHLSQLLIPHLARKAGAAIINVTSGLSFVPLANVPIYCATKAALHSFTLSLRHQLAGSGIEVIELIPPAVNTDLGGPGLHTFGVPLDEFADGVFDRLTGGEKEVAYGTSEKSRSASRAELDRIFEHMNSAR